MSDTHVRRTSITASELASWKKAADRRRQGPAASLVGLYATALAGGIVAYAIARPAAAPFAFSRLWHPTIAAVGIGALLIEMGFLLAYRSAWPVSTASVITNGVAAVLLLVIGAAMFGETVTITKAAGVLLCLLGVSLLQR